MLLPFWNIFEHIFSHPTKMFQAHFPISCPSSRIFSFSMEPCSFYCQMLLTKLYLYTKCAHWYWRVIGSGDLLVDRAKNYMCTSYPVFIYISRNILDGNDFMDMTPKREAKKKKKTDKLDLIKIKKKSVHQRTQSRTLPYDPAIPLLHVYSKGNENRISKRYLHSYIYCIIVHNSQNMDTT